ncbi:glycosyltransferase family 4 protein [Paracoccaceae bacterium]|nr:glycosyltransferase family 4 protein [Paracoccaceae bacterium]MDC0867650.1 glycosyltransferase family 4 protein [Paracoccaceae bacterium]
MKILVVTKSLNRGGAASGNIRLLRQLELMGCELVLITEASSSFKHDCIRKLERILDYVFLGSDCHAFKIFYPTFNMSKLLSVHKPDVVYFGDISGNLVDYSCDNLQNYTVVHRLSDIWPYGGVNHYRPNHKWLWSPKLPRVNIMLCPSNWIRQEVSSLVTKPGIMYNILRNSGLGISRKNVQSLNGGGIKLGFIAAKLTEKRKNLIGLLNILDQLVGEINFELHVFGGGKFSVDRHYIKYHGGFTSAGMDNVFQNFDVLVVPSSSDNSPNVIVEALSYGKPIIGNATTGVVEYVSDARTGKIVDFSAVNAVSQFFSAIGEIVDKYELLSSNCLDQYHHEHHPVQQAERFLKIIHEHSKTKREEIDY